MIRRISDWFDSRTGYRRLLELYRARTIPGGPRWQYVTGSCLLWVLVVEVATGLMLMATYSPSSTNAWASVHYIEQMAGGSFLRGVHYWAGQALIVLLGVHTVRVLLAGVFRAPRELIWAVGLLLFPLTLFWAITGNPLAWTQRGYGQIQVETNIIASTPLVGPVLQRILIGGDEMGHLTLTHLYFLHVAAIPLAAFVLLAVHVSQVYRHGTAVSSASEHADSQVAYWPYQTARNAAALAVVLGVVATLAWRLGAPLDAPADPTLTSHPRPEWYFMFLFELRRYFTGQWEIVATLVIPLAALALLLLMPALDRALPLRAGVALRVLIVGGGVAGWGTLTYLAVARDWNDPEFQLARAEQRRLAARACELATLPPKSLAGALTPGGIPPEGAIALLRTDPATRGPRLFAEHCAGCHSHGAQFSAGDEAADLEGFGGEAWIQDLLKNPASPRFFGRTKLTRMRKWVEENLQDISDDERAEVDSAVRWLAGQPRGLPEDGDKTSFAQGFEAFSNWCIDCHKYEGEGGTDIAGPDFTGYGSAEWIHRTLVAPDSAERYGKRSSMPSFADRLSGQEVRLLATWLTTDRSTNRAADDSRAEP
jgi:ubiquinol-cytochrome c reductase cytochrome b subunit